MRFGFPYIPNLYMILHQKALCQCFGLRPQMFLPKGMALGAALPTIAKPLENLLRKRSKSSVATGRAASATLAKPVANILHMRILFLHTGSLKRLRTPRQSRRAGGRSDRRLASVTVKTLQMNGFEPAGALTFLPLAWYATCTSARARTPRQIRGGDQDGEQCGTTGIDCPTN